MPRILDGKAAAAALAEKLRARIQSLAAEGITPCLAVLRVGDREDDVAYERGVSKKAASLGIALRRFSLPQTAATEDVLTALAQINDDSSIHGCLIFLPLPQNIDEQAVRAALKPEKDCDGITAQSQAGLYADTGAGFPPCTAQSCMEILKFFGIDPAGKRAVVLGRSLTVGRPLAMMLMHENATVTICHRKTRDLPDLAREADILVAAMGVRGAVTPDFVSEGQILLDVGIHVNEEGRLCGDVAPETLAHLGPKGASTPVPGGVGAVTTLVMLSHVVEAAEKARKNS